MKLRLDKYLSDMGLGTRSEIKKAVRRGLASVNGAVEKHPERSIDTEQDRVVFQNAPVAYIRYEYYMLNKPAGVISASEDRREQTAVDLIGERQRNDLFPVGRLDRNTEGLLLITNDGQLAHRLLSPRRHVDKVYYAKILGHVTEEDVTAFRRGVDIGEAKPTLPADLRILRTAEESGTVISEIEVTVCEGKFHQIKRMFEAVGKKVLYLKRLQMGPLLLDEALAPGEYRRLTETECENLSRGNKQ